MAARSRGAGAEEMELRRLVGGKGEDVSCIGGKNHLIIPHTDLQSP